MLRELHQRRFIYLFEVRSNIVLLILRALSFLKVDDKDSALKELFEILKITPDHIDANMMIGKIFLQIGREQDSSKYFWRVNELEPNNEEIKSYVTIMKNKMKDCIKEAERNILRENYKCAVLWLNKGLKFYPKNPECLLLKASIFKKLRQVDDAVLILAEAKGYANIHFLPQGLLNASANLHNELGLEMLSNNKTDEAIKLFEEAIHLIPTNPYFYINKGDCLYKLKDYDSALKIYASGLEFDLGNLEIKARISSIYYKAAVALFNKKQFENSLLNIEKAIEICNSSCDYFILQARCFREKSRSNEAIQSLGMALNLDPTNKKALMLMKSLDRNY